MTIVHREIVEVLQDLPIICAVVHPTTGDTVLVKRGTRGYWPAPRGLHLETFNRRHGVTPQQYEAMLYGSLFGFDVPVADPLNHQRGEEALPVGFEPTTFPARPQT